MTGVLAIDDEREEKRTAREVTRERKICDCKHQSSEESVCRLDYWTRCRPFLRRSTHSALPGSDRQQYEIANSKFEYNWETTDSQRNSTTRISEMASFRIGGGSGGAVAKALTSHHGDPGSILGGFTPRPSHVGIALDNGACRRVFSGYSHFPRPCIPAPLHLRVSFYVMYGDDGHLRVPAGKPHLASAQLSCRDTRPATTRDYWGTVTPNRIAGRDSKPLMLTFHRAPAMYNDIFIPQPHTRRARWSSGNSHWTRIREDTGSISGLAILISALHGFTEITPGECWDGSATVTMADSFPNPSPPRNLRVLPMAVAVTTPTETLRCIHETRFSITKPVIIISNAPPSKMAGVYIDSSVSRVLSVAVAKTEQKGTFMNAIISTTEFFLYYRGCGGNASVTLASQLSHPGSSLRSVNPHFSIWHQITKISKFLGRNPAHDHTGQQQEGNEDDWPKERRRDVQRGIGTKEGGTFCALLIMSLVVTYAEMITGSSETLLTSHPGEPGSIPDGVAPGFSHAGMVLICGFLRGSPVFPSLAFRCCSKLTSLHHRVIKPADQRHRPARFPTCEIPGMTQPRIELGSPWWEAGRLTAQPPRPLFCSRRHDCSGG
ncbi:hypothetical protein PR048_019433 [Dryococelus australis]|uniref:Uncharacterized protein n=1 Tax=Dryococelus australis TaxID=614101 RepID=A0ABQ9H3K9_9NEOP|nr:hypothetical protein PR048_019433 [Dryococelus australis]